MLDCHFVQATSYRPASIIDATKDRIFLINGQESICFSYCINQCCNVRNKSLLRRIFKKILNLDLNTSDNPITGFKKKKAQLKLDGKNWPGNRIEIRFIQPTYSAVIN